MSKTASELARHLGGEVIGLPSLRLTELRSFGEPGESVLSPLFYKRTLRGARTLPAAVLATRELGSLAVGAGVLSAIVHDRPTLALAELIDLFYPEQPKSKGVHPTAVIEPSAVVDQTAWIGPHAVIEQGVTIGARSQIGAGAVICLHTIIGADVRIGPGAVIGAEGFGFVPSEQGLRKMRHVGRVIIGDRVEVGANSCIDRGTLGVTEIGQDTKLDNLVQVGHNARVGERVLIAGQVGLAGSTVVQDEAMLGGQVGIADHLSVGARARIAAKSGVVGHVPADAVFAGYPAIPANKWKRAMAWLSRQSSRKR